MVSYPVLKEGEAFIRWKEEAVLDEDYINGYQDYVEDQKRENFPAIAWDEWLFVYFKAYV
jgi:hypothetical protein